MYVSGRSQNAMKAIVSTCGLFYPLTRTITEASKSSAILSTHLPGFDVISLKLPSPLQWEPIEEEIIVWRGERRRRGNVEMKLTGIRQQWKFHYPQILPEGCRSCQTVTKLQCFRKAEKLAVEGISGIPSCIVKAANWWNLLCTRKSWSILLIALHNVL